MSEETIDKKAGGAFFFLLALAAFGALNLYNHMMGGPYTAWIVDAKEVARLAKLEVKAAECINTELEMEAKERAIERRAKELEARGKR